MRIRLNRSEVFIARCQFSFPILPFVHTRYRQSNENWPPRFKNMNESEGQKENIKCTLAQVSFEQCTVFSNANSFCVRLLNEKKLIFFSSFFLFLFCSLPIIFRSLCGAIWTACRAQIMFSRLEVSSLSSAAPLESIGNFNIIYLSLFLLTGYVQSTGAFCPEHHWWQGELNACTPCTVCDKSQSIVLRPCSLHLDAICGTLDDLELELSWLQSAVEQQRVSNIVFFRFPYNCEVVFSVFIFVFKICNVFVLYKRCAT